MARQRISEYRAKSLILTRMDMPYSGIQIQADKEVVPQLVQLNPSQTFVVKVDQGVKKRMKRGLIALNTSVSDIPQRISEIADKGFQQFIIEPMASYDQEYEKYFAIERQREGYMVSVSPKGGIDIEEHADTVRPILLPYDSDQQESGKQEIQEVIGLSPEKTTAFLQLFDEYYFSFLEINPLVVHGDVVHIIDLAVEVDSVSEFFADKGWTRQDFTFGEKGTKSHEETVVDQLKEQSQAAFTLDLLNPDGSIFMLLSGGGASLVLADEVANLGLGHELANYGEYSGNPNAEETYLYTSQVLSLLLRSKAQKKVLIIGGGVANFTDIKATFTGVIKALAERKNELREQHIKIFVRRGGPNQQEGLKHMREFLETEGLLGRVVGPDIMLTEIVKDAIASIK